MKKIALIDLTLTEPRHTDEGPFAGRREKLEKLAEILGFEAQFIHPRELIEKSPEIVQSVRESQMAWWFGRIPEPNEGETVWRVLHEICKNSPNAPVIHEDPDWIDEAFSVKRFVPVAARTGVLQAQTQCIDLPESFLFQSSAWLRTTLSWRLRGVKLAKKGSFVRTYMGTTKVSPYLSVVRNRKELIDRSQAMLETLKGRHKIGGLAIRELLEISLRYDKTGYIPLGREYRVFIVFGRPVFWSIDVDLFELAMKMKLSDLEELAALSEAEEQEIVQWSQKLGAEFKTRFLVADFAILVDGRVALVETNPGLMCGWAHDATLLGAYGPFLSQISGTSWPSQDWDKLADDMGLALWGRGKLFNFLGSPSGPINKQELEHHRKTESQNGAS